GRIGAFGKGSSACALSVFGEPPPLLASTAGGAGGRAGADGVAALTSIFGGALGGALRSTPGSFACDFDFRGLSHFSQRMPDEISRPHMKHLRAIGDQKSYA